MTGSGTLVPATALVDASASSDPFGTIDSYAWDFGDGTTASGLNASHTYAAAGSYVVTLTVTDNHGATDSSTQTFIANAAPEAVVDVSTTSGLAPLAIAAVGAGSSDPFGSIVSYEWDFGDGNSASGVAVNHTYSAAGDYTLTLTVTDDNGAQDSASELITVNLAPLPQINVTPLLGFAPLTISADGNGSSDPNGTIVSYDWDFGDGNGAMGLSVGHTYAAPGNYTVLLTVTDDQGATASVSQTVTANTAPQAAFTISPTNALLPVTVSADASASSDAFGSIVSYAWDFGDGTTATGVSAGHTYNAAGVYTVTLTVTDDNGATDSTSQLVIANIAPVADVQADAAEGIVDFTLNVDASASSDAFGSIVSYAWDFGDGGSASGAVASHLYTVPGEYTVTLTVTDNHGATDTATVPFVALPKLPPSFVNAPQSVSVAPGGTASFSVEVVGTPPFSFQWLRDEQPIPGAVGMSYGIANVGLADNGAQIKVVVTNDVTTVTSDAAIITLLVPNDVPTAAFSATPAGAQLGVAFDGSASVDPDGSISDFAWDFGDGSSGTGALITHQYAVPGDYDVTLTVTDNLGATDSSTQTVSVNLPEITVAGAGANLATADNTIDRDAGGLLDLGTSWVNDHRLATAWLTFDLGSVQSVGEVRLAPRGDRAYTLEILIGDTLVGGQVDGTPQQCVTPDIGRRNPIELQTCILTPAAGQYVTVRSTDVASFKLHGIEFGESVPVNQPPVAAFVASGSATDPLGVDLDASSSADADGSVSAYAWDFGDGNSGSGEIVSHSYAADGVYLIRLTVTDNEGASSSLEQTVTIGAPVAIGKAPVSVHAVGSRPANASRLIDEYANGEQVLPNHWTSDGSLANAWFTLDLGSTQTVAEVRIAPRTDVTYDLEILVGDVLVDDQVSGSGASCTTPLLGPVKPTALFTCVIPPSSGRYVTVRAVNRANLRVYGVEVHVQLAPPTLPTAAFSAAVDALDPLQLNLDASASSDPDGTLSGFDWDFGDGNVGSGSSVSHSYASSGTYMVTLTVTDDDGNTASAAQILTLGAPTSGKVPVIVSAVGINPSKMDFLIDELASGAQDLSTFWNDGNNSAKSWFTLDLGTAHSVSEVLLAPRRDRFFDIEITVSNTVNSQGEAIGTADNTCSYANLGITVPAELVGCAAFDAEGRFVTVRNLSPRSIRVYGVEVIATPLP